jgi:hypothetical protein
MAMAAFDWSIASRCSYVLWRKTFTGGWKARARAFWHHAIRGYRYEICGECGRPVDVVWTADDELWLEVVGQPGGLLCIPCFDTKVERSGLFLCWTPELGG